MYGWVLQGFGEHKMLIIAAAAKHVQLYLENGGQRVPLSPPSGSHPPLPGSSSSSSGGGDEKGSSRSKRGGRRGRGGGRGGGGDSARLEEPWECSEDISEEEQASPSRQSQSQSQRLSATEEEDRLDDHDDKGSDSGSGSGSNGAQHPHPHTLAWLDQSPLTEQQPGEQQPPRLPTAKTQEASSAAPRHQHQNHERAAPPVQQLSSATTTTTATATTCDMYTTEAVLNSLGRFSCRDGDGQASGSDDNVAPFDTPPTSSGPSPSPSPGRDCGCAPHDHPFPPPHGSSSNTASGGGGGGGLIDKELSAILREGERHELFADSVHSCDYGSLAHLPAPPREHRHSREEMVTRAECIFMMEALETVRNVCTTSHY